MLGGAGWRCFEVVQIPVRAGSGVFWGGCTVPSFPKCPNMSGKQMARPWNKWDALPVGWQSPGHQRRRARQPERSIRPRPILLTKELLGLSGAGHCIGIASQRRTTQLAIAHAACEQSSTSSLLHKHTQRRHLQYNAVSVSLVILRQPP